MSTETSTEAAGEKPAVVNGRELADELGITSWQVTRGVELGAIPQRCTDRGWRREVADQLPAKVAEILATIEDHEALGANRIAGALEEASGVEGVDRAEIQLGTDWGSVARRARQFLAPGAAVLLDVETTDLDGQIVEVAIQDAATGRMLVDTLVKPVEGVTISAGAYGVHGIKDEDLTDAPPWEKVLPKVRKATKGRMVLAYNESFDRGRIVQHTEAVGKWPMHLADPDNWYCLMTARSQFYRHGRRSLDGPHRAKGDCVAGRALLEELAEGQGRRHRP